MTFEHDVPALSRSRQIRLLIIAVVAVVAIYGAITLARALFRHPETPPPTLPPGELQLTQGQTASMKIQTVQADDGEIRTGATGMIDVDGTQSTPVFLPYSGQVVNVFVEAGARVGAGQPLLSIRTGDIADARNALMSAEAQRAAASTSLRVAQENAARAEQVYKTAGGALKDYQQAQADLASAQSAVRVADAAAAAARGKLSVFGGGGGSGALATLRAPISGVVATRAVSAGQFVQVGGSQPAFVIADLSRVWLIAQVAESDATRVKVGDHVNVTTNAWPGRVFDAVIDNVGAQLDPVTHRLPVRATIANADGALKPQMFASFTIKAPSSTPGALAVPAVAVINEGDTARVWVYLGKGRVKAQNVTVGESHDGYVTITSGIAPGTKIITDGALFVNEAGLGD
ncbi:efflux RND transporter periplasmic adaptor subunit [Novosphingobium sp.]|uniref:efflux RND transporter periplasmic adaptor subunit n=1 Tax=Novosphingobium sp. TaxID=1874826 RepID=UPI00352B43B2